MSSSELDYLKYKLDETNKRIDALQSIYTDLNKQVLDTINLFLDRKFKDIMDDIKENISKEVKLTLLSDTEIQSEAKLFVQKTLKILKRDSRRIVPELIRSVISVQREILRKDHKDKIDLITNCDDEIKELVKRYDGNLSWQEGKEFSRMFTKSLNESVELINNKPTQQLIKEENKND